MKNLNPPPGGGRLQRSVAACLGAILEVAVSEVPVPEEHHPQPWVVWRDWLAQRALGLAPIAEPTRFNWPGPWLALLRAADGDGHVAAVAFGSPPGIAWHPLGGAETFDALEVGYIVAPADVALGARAATDVTRQRQSGGDCDRARGRGEASHDASR